MNDHSIAFITCVNDEEQYEECLRYINNLNIPEGYEIEKIAIREAESMASGYNVAMNRSESKFKVYLHQDIFIINKNFLYNILNIFNNNSEVGMIGLIGNKTILPENLKELSKEKYGEIYDYVDGIISLKQFNEIKDEYKEVQTIDGMVMITQNDIEWKEELFDGWYFYDMSQSVEFLKRGYKVIIPKQSEPWCIHDNNTIINEISLKKYEGIFLKNYKKTIINIINKNIENKKCIDIDAAVEWRNNYIQYTDDKMLVKKIDEYIIKKLGLYQDKTNEIFKFDEIQALGVVNSNKLKFFEYVNIVEKYIGMNDYENAARGCFWAAQFASENHPGFYFSKEIENVLLKCAKNLPCSSSEISLPKVDTNKRKVLHILSEGYKTGGHTRLVKNWIDSDKNSVHSLITTWQINSTPDWLIDEAKKSGGWVYSLEKIEGFLDKASALRKISYEWADVIVLHIHMYDPIAVMAFGIEGGPPVLFMNHADHVFWIGTSIIDKLINFRESGEELAINKRNIVNNSILPLPLSQSNINSNYRKLIREKYDIDQDTIVLLTVATPYKFNSFSRFNYIDMLTRIMQENKNVVAYVVGPSNEGIWEKANKETNGRIIPMGVREDIDEFYAMADIYIDSYMFGSVTSALDAGINEVPIVALQNYNNRTLSFNDISYTTFEKEFNSIDEYINYINMLISNKDYRKALGKDIFNKVKEQHVENWKDYLDKIYNGVKNKKHKVNDNLRLECNLGNEDLFLALFQNSKIKKKNN